MSKKKERQRELLALPPSLVVNYIVIYDFCSSAADVIHPSNSLRHVLLPKCCHAPYSYAIKHRKSGLKSKDFKPLKSRLVLFPLRFEYLLTGGKWY